MALTSLISSILIAIVSWPLINLTRNYMIARRIGLPILITPLGLLNPVWAIGEFYFAPLLRRVPFGLASFVDYSSFSCLFSDRYRRHERLGLAYVVVSPSEIQIMLADAKAAADVLSRRKDFVKSETLYKPLELFGRNVDTLNGEDWQRHRRLTTPPFNEKNSKLVWTEALAQAKGMLNSWIKKGRAGIIGFEKDTMTLALHVLTSAGFGQSYPFDGGVSSPAEGHSLTYRDALRLILTNLLPSIIMASMPLPSSILSRKLQEVKQAVIEFKQYMAEMVEKERKAIKYRQSTNDNLMSVLIRAAASDEKETGRNGLTDDEIFGNLFIYNLAGHDTTAGSIAFAIVMLSANPQWQDWVSEEINAVFEGKVNAEEWDYEEAFPQLKRCLAVMFETLRLVGVLPVIPKYTGDLPQILKIDSREYVIPPRIFVNLHLAALHSRPEYWGSDSLVWRPDRWITSSGGSGDLAQETLLEPQPGTFLPWAGGPRVCPGRKFAQVEFVAVMAILFQKNRVTPVLEPGETIEDASKRLHALVEDSDLKIIMRMRHPEKLKLVWGERD